MQAVLLPLHVRLGECPRTLPGCVDIAGDIAQAPRRRSQFPRFSESASEDSLLPRIYPPSSNYVHLRGMLDRRRARMDTHWEWYLHSRSPHARELRRLIKRSQRHTLYYHELLVAVQLVKHEVFEISADPEGCCLMRVLLTLGEDSHRRDIADEMRGRLVHLAMSASGCSVMETLMRVGNAETRNNIVDELNGTMLNLSMDPDARRLVQTMLDVCCKTKQENILREFHGNAMCLLHSKHGNHVLQKAIEMLPPSAVHFILVELRQCGPLARLARDEKGCRVIQRILEHFTRRGVRCEVDDDIDDILRDAEILLHDVFGRFVLQHILEHGKDEHRSCVVKALLVNIRSSVTGALERDVFDKALVYAPATDREVLARAASGVDRFIPDRAMQRERCARARRFR